MIRRNKKIARSRCNGLQTIIKLSANDLNLIFNSQSDMKMWGYMPVIPTLGRRIQKIMSLRLTWAYRASHCFKKKNTRIKIK